MEIETNIQYNQLHEAACVHERSEGRRLTPTQAGEASRYDGTPKFAPGGNHDDEVAEHPLVHAGHQIHPRPHARERKEGREEQNRDHRVQVARARPGHETVVREDRAEQKRPKDGVDTSGYQ